MRRIVPAAIVAGALAALVACGRDQIPEQGADYEKLCDRKGAQWKQHYDSLPVLLARRDAGGTVSGGRAAALSVFRGLEDRTKDQEFEKGPQPIALLDLEPRGNAPTTVCLLSYRDASAGGGTTEPQRWRVVYYDLRARQVLATSPVVYRMVGEADEDQAVFWKKRPRPAARFDFLTAARLAQLRARGEAPAPTIGAARREDIDGFVAWYRCGSGCCGASLESFY